MQTFLPHKKYKKSARCLDYKRLGKQRVECKQIYLALTNGGGWVNHPAVQMWKGHEYQLLKYAIAITEEWISRGYNDSLLPFFRTEIETFGMCKKPTWMGNKKFHNSHKFMLMKKDPEHYGQFEWKITECSGYWWPTKEE